MIRILQISDIHFLCCEEEEEMYATMRKRFKSDIEAMITLRGLVNYIIIIGDIANKGKQGEYKKAIEFIDTITSIFEDKGKKPNVLVVPGNHDLNRDAYKKTRNVLRPALYSKNGETLFSGIKSNEAETLRILYAPYMEYNNFAMIYDSRDEVSETIMEEDGELKPDALSKPKLYWRRTLGESGGYPVVLYGLNSTLLCDGEEVQKDELEDGKHQLFLPKSGYNISTDDNAVNISMIHHPLDWLINEKKIEETLDDHFQIQFFGHIHKQSSEQDDVIKIYSGAFQPEESDSSEYQPIYNIIELDVVDDVIKLELFCQKWNGHSFERYESESGMKQAKMKKYTSSWEQPQPKQPKAADMSYTEIPIGDINYKFVSLPSVKRDKIMASLAPMVFNKKKSDRANISAFIKYIRENNMYNLLLAELNK